MNTKLIGVVVASCALMLTGCLSYKGMKERIDSGNPAEVAAAKNQILEAASLVRYGTPDSDLVELRQCLTLIADDKMLLDFIDDGYGQLLEDAAKNVTFKDENLIVDVLQGKRPMAKHNEETVCNVYHKVLIPQAIKLCNDAKLLKKFCSHNSGHSAIAIERVKQLGDQEVIVDILPRVEYEYKDALIDCVKSTEYKFKMLKSAVEIGNIEKIIAGVCEKDAATYLMQDAKIEECAISDWSARAKVLKKLASRIDDESLIVEIAIKNAHVRNFVIDKVKSKDARDKVLDALLAEWKEAKDKEADRCVGPILKMVKDEEQVQKLLKNLHHSLGKRDWHDLVDRITDAATADMVYDNLFVYDNGLGSNDYFSELLAKIAKKIGAEKRSGIVKRLQSEKNDDATCSFGGLHLGMNALDGFVLASVTKNDVDFSLTYDAEKAKTGLSREDITVGSMYFSVKYLAHDLQCEDSEVLYNMIHRYVMKKTGKALRYDYAKYTNVEIDRHICWQTYSNSKLGIKIWFDEKRGVVKVTQI